MVVRGVRAATLWVGRRGLVLRPGGGGLQVRVRLRALANGARMTARIATGMAAIGGQTAPVARTTPDTMKVITMITKRRPN